MNPKSMLSEISCTQVRTFCVIPSNLCLTTRKIESMVTEVQKMVMRDEIV